MSNNSSSSGIGGILGIAVCIALLFVMRKIFPSLGKLLLAAGIVIAVLIVLVVVLVIVFSKSTDKDNKKTTGLSDEVSAILSKGRSNLMELRRYSMSIKNQQIRTSSEEICKSVDKILRTLREQPEDVPDVRQFFNYYLPTFGKIMKKYAMLEKNGIPTREATESTIMCLADIKAAMEKQHTNLFEDDMLDLSVEMEALKANCKRDGLLADEDFNVSDTGNINLTL